MVIESLDSLLRVSTEKPTEFSDDEYEHFVDALKKQLKNEIKLNYKLWLCYELICLFIYFVLRCLYIAFCNKKFWRISLYCQRLK